MGGCASLAITTWTARKGKAGPAEARCQHRQLIKSRAAHRGRPISFAEQRGPLLLHGARRSNDLKRDIPGISDKVLSAHLRELEADGIVSRREFHEEAVMA